MSRLVCGIDESGRGSFLGPLVIAGVTLPEDKVPELEEIGVKDSKDLTRTQRNQLCVPIVDIVDDYCVVKIAPRHIDRNVWMYNLNHLEAKHMARIIQKLSPDISYVDSCDVNEHRFGETIKRLSGAEKIVSRHHADSLFPAVSAASILAKITRDDIMDGIQSRYKFIASGYPADPRTIQYVDKYVKENEELPIFARQSWRPANNYVL